MCHALSAARGPPATAGRDEQAVARWSAGRAGPRLSGSKYRSELLRAVQADAGGSWWPPHANFGACGGGGAGAGAAETGEGRAVARGESEERGACGGGSSAGDTSYGECTSREGLESDGSSSGGSCSDDSGVQVWRSRRGALLGVRACGAATTGPVSQAVTCQASLAANLS
jgi:hypothetical protein